MDVVRDVKLDVLKRIQRKGLDEDSGANQKRS